MGSFTNTRTIDAPVDEVWAVVRDFANVARIHPAVVHSQATGSGEPTGLGAERRCDFDTAGTRYVNERITRFDEQARSYDIDITGGTFRLPVRSMAATIEVEPDGPQRTTVRFVSRYDGNLAQRAMGATVMKSRLGRIIDGVLAGIQYHLDTGRDVTGFNVLEVVDA